MRFWRIGSSLPGGYGADDLTGVGARRAGARWNPKGTSAVYASYHLATAVLETLVHIGRRKQPADRFVVAIDVEDSVVGQSNRFSEIKPIDLPAGWNEHPPGPVSQSFGVERFRSGFIGFAVPSAILAEELNIVLNPLHPDFGKAVKTRIIRPFAFDPRL